MYWSSDLCSSDLHRRGRDRRRADVEGDDRSGAIGIRALTEQRSLFDPWLPPGLSYREEAIGADEEKELIQQIDQDDPAPFRFQQWTGKRRTRSIGRTSGFTTGRMKGT